MRYKRVFPGLFWQTVLSEVSPRCHFVRWLISNEKGTSGRRYCVQSQDIMKVYALFSTNALFFVFLSCVCHTVQYSKKFSINVKNEFTHSQNCYDDYALNHLDYITWTNYSVPLSLTFSRSVLHVILWRNKIILNKYLIQTAFSFFYGITCLSLNA